MGFVKEPRLSKKEHSPGEKVIPMIHRGFSLGSGGFELLRSDLHDKSLKTAEEVNKAVEEGN